MIDDAKMNDEGTPCQGIRGFVVADHDLI